LAGNVPGSLVMIDTTLLVLFIFEWPISSAFRFRRRVQAMMLKRFSNDMVKFNRRSSPPTLARNESLWWNLSQENLLIVLLNLMVNVLEVKY
jgi:hypothetical protein